MVGLKEMRNWFGRGWEARKALREMPGGRPTPFPAFPESPTPAHSPTPLSQLRQSRRPETAVAGSTIPSLTTVFCPIDDRLFVLCLYQCVARSPVLCQHLQRSDLQDSSNWLLVVEEPLNSCLFLVCSCANYWAKRPVSWLSQQGSDDY